MPVIAAHCRPGSPRAELHALVCNWPANVLVQWGGEGLVYSRTGNYCTAFFEAFPLDGGFIRGEGETIEQAECTCFAKFEKTSNCQHVWGRRGYTNTGGTCLKCKLFAANRFQEIYQIGAWRRPLSPIEVQFLNLRETGFGAPENARYARKLALRKKLFGTNEAPR